MYEWIEVRAPDDFDQLESMLDAEYDPHRVARILKKGLKPRVRGLLVEYNYVDKDYRSVFYNFYSKMGRPYRSDCVRLHFFDEKVSFDVETLSLSCADDSIENLSHHYHGYMVVRPTIANTVGRTALDPKVRAGAEGDVLVSKQKSHLLGHTLRWEAFPSMDQHTDVVVCAHVACWSILRHYSERYAQHRELLVHDIKVLGHLSDPGGLVPSKGLDIYQAERVFQAAGTYPLVVAKDDKAPADFYDQLLAYLESGFPLFVEVLEWTHAIVAVGREWTPTTGRRAVPDSVDIWKRVKSVLVIDDNKLPYVSIPAKGKLKNTYTAAGFTRFIVALPEKIFYPASAVSTYAPSTLLNMLTGEGLLSLDEAYVIRFFVMTLSSLRCYARAHASALGNELVNIFMRLQTAQFVWVVEYATSEQWSRSEVMARAVLDATASPTDQAPIWLAYTAKRAMIFDRSSVPTQGFTFDLASSSAEVLTRLESNLRPVAG